MKKKIKNFNIRTVAEAKSLAKSWLADFGLQKSINFGLPEIDDRYSIWRVPLLSYKSNAKIGEVVIDAITTLVDQRKSTKPGILESRLLNTVEIKIASKKNVAYEISELRNTIALGDAETILSELPSKSVDLIFTSPPYFNAKPEYSDYINYEEYLIKMRKIIIQCYNVLNEGRFFVMNTSPILIRRSNRNQSSKRIPVTFDLHRIFDEEGFEFIDDILWVKPEGAGWATGRGRRFSADRNPLQYKPVPITEYLIVYRKKSDKLIDWNIRSYPNKSIVEESRIKDDYEKTNLWHITPQWDKKHPAIFPLELAKKVIAYYSFKTDVVLDPFAGIGTTGKAAALQGRRFVLIDIEKSYVEEIRNRAKSWLSKEEFEEIFFINSNSNQIDPEQLL